MDIPTLVSADWLNEHTTHSDLLILDATLAKPKTATTDIPNHGSQIPGARYFDIDHKFSDQTIDLPHMICDAKQFQQEAEALGINDDSIVIIYDQHGIYSSPRAWWMLKSMGHKNVAILDGGLPEWVEQGFPIEPKKEAFDQNGKFLPNLNSDCFVNAEFVMNTIEDENILVLDARSKGRFDGLEPEPRAGLRGGHIPSSISLPFHEVLDGTKMKTAEELNQLFAPLNLNRKKLIFSCGSGLTACIILFAAHLTGYEDLAVYDGSWSEWGRESDLPVA